MTFPDLQFWARLAGAIAVEAAVLVILAMAAQRVLRQVRWQRAVWETALLGLLALVASELTGFGRGMIGMLLVPAHQTIPLAPDTTSFHFFQFDAGRLPLALPSRPSATSAKAVWWPGGLWLAGIALVLGRAFLAQLFLVILRVRSIEITSVGLREREARVSALLGLTRRISLICLPQSVSPMAMGLFRPGVGLPPDFEERFSPTEQDAILAHELAHLAARDPLWFALADATTALLWWHPLVWWARRSLRNAAERAADEAASLVPDGPALLARCLVDLAKRMTGAAGWGWAGINGGFRSQLGQRVERLLRLPAGRRLPSRSWPVTATLALTVMPGLVLCTAAFQARGQPSNGIRSAWETSPGAALLATRAPEASVTTNAATEYSPRVASRLRDAKMLYEMGRLNPAEMVLKEILRDDPGNKSAVYFLHLIKAAQPGSSAGAGHSFNELPFHSDLAEGPNVLMRLRTTYIGEFDCHDSPLWDVAYRLSVAVPGTDYISHPLVFQATNGTESVRITFPHPLKRVSVAEVLDAIIEGADHPIMHGLNGSTVVFLPQVVETFHSLIFRVNPATFPGKLRAFGAASGQPVEAHAFPNQFDDGPRLANENHDSLGGPTAPPGSSHARLSPDETEAMNRVFRAYLQSFGLNFQSLGKNLFLDARHGFIIVRASDDELNKVADALQALDTAPAQITISAKFTQLSRHEATLFGFDSLLQSPAKTSSLILSKPRFEAALRAIEQQTSEDILSAPPLRTISGEATRLSSDGVSVDVTPTARPDGQTIEINAAANVGLDATHWHVAGSGALRDDETLVLGECATNAPAAATLNLVFVTPHIFDASGRFAHLGNGKASAQ